MALILGLAGAIWLAQRICEHRRQARSFQRRLQAVASAHFLRLGL